MIQCPMPNAPILKNDFLVLLHQVLHPAYCGGKRFNYNSALPPFAYGLIVILERYLFGTC